MNTSFDSNRANTSGLMSPDSVRGVSTLGGGVELLLGPMFSGKTSELTRRIRRAIVAGKKVLVLKWAGDSRYANAKPVVVTHDGQEMKAKCVEKLEEAHNIAWSYDVVAIDEGQFFGDLAEYAEKWADMGTLVIVAALDGDFLRRPFDNVLSLIPLAESVEKMSAVCHMCHSEAAFTMKIGAPTSTAQIEVGGKEKYLPVCRGCHRQSHASPETFSPVREMAALEINGRSRRLSQQGNRQSKGTRSPLIEHPTGITVPAMSLR